MCIGTWKPTTRDKKSWTRMTKHFFCFPIWNLSTNHASQYALSLSNASTGDTLNRVVKKKGTRSPPSTSSWLWAWPWPAFSFSVALLPSQEAVNSIHPFHKNKRPWGLDQGTWAPLGITFMKRTSWWIWQWLFDHAEVSHILSAATRFNPEHLKKSVLHPPSSANNRG